jgi:hypothetical protein
MHRSAAASLLASLLLASVARAETRASLEVGPIVGVAHDVRAEGGMSELSPSQNPAGLELRAGAAARYFEGGILLSGTASSGPTTLAAGLYAGPTLSLGKRLRVTLDGEFGVQDHGGFGSEFLFADAQSSDVSLPFAGARASVWVNLHESAKVTLSLGLLAEARFDLGHGTGHATVTPSSLCLGILECLLEATSPPQPFTQDYDVGGHVVYFGVVMRWSVSPSANPSPTPHPSWIQERH